MSAIQLAYHPVSQGNPFQRMLYERCDGAGIAVEGLRRLPDCEPAVPIADSPRILHLHWTDRVLRRASNRAEAERAAAGFEGLLDAYGAAGWKLIWTVHNVLPHEARRPWLEARVCQAIADRATVIHVMCEGTVTATAPHYRLPRDRIVVIPHASYLGVYPDSIAASQARERLGLQPDDTVLAVFGGIRRYKGMIELLDAFDAAHAAEPSLRLVIAGKPMRYRALDALQARCEGNPAIRLDLGTVPDGDVQIYLKAADALVLPHARGLNSGQVGLAQAFGRPVIAPDLGCIAEQVPDGCGVTYPARDLGALTEAMAGAKALKEPRYGEAALARARDNPPEAMARDFAALAAQAAGRASESP